MGLAFRHRIIEIGTEISMCLNLELNALTNEHYRKDFGRIIFIQNMLISYIHT